MPAVEYQFNYGLHSSIRESQRDLLVKLLKDFDLLVAPTLRHTTVLIFDPNRANFDDIKNDRHRFSFIVASDWVYDCLFAGRVISFRHQDFTRTIRGDDEDDNDTIYTDDTSVEGGAMMASDSEAAADADNEVTPPDMPQPPQVTLVKANHGFSIRATQPAVTYTESWLFWFYSLVPNASKTTTARQYTRVLNKAFAVQPPMRYETVQVYLRNFEGCTDDYVNKINILRQATLDEDLEAHAYQEIDKYTLVV
jgi:hypothetical protein